MNAEELTTASGSNPNPFKKPCDIIPKVWRQSGSLSRDEAIEKFGRENDQRWKAHQANVAKEVQRITGQTEQELKEEAASLACISREACTGRMEEFLNMVCPGALPSELQQSTRQSIRNAFQPAFGSHHKPHSLQTFTKYSKPHPLLHSIGEEQWELPSLGTQKEQKAERWTLARSFQIIGTDIELHVTAVPDIMWRNGIVRLKHDVHDSMDDKWREADETMVCITHILTEDDSQGRFDQGPDTVGVLAEYLLLKNAGSLVMECRDEAHVTAPAHQISAHQADDSTAGTMVITVFRKNQSHQVWEEKVMPGVKPFCQIIQRLLIDEAWQKGYLQAPDRAVWYEEAIQQL